MSCYKSTSFPHILCFRISRYRIEVPPRCFFSHILSICLQNSWVSKGEDGRKESREPPYGTRRLELADWGFDTPIQATGEYTPAYMYLDTPYTDVHPYFIEYLVLVPADLVVRQSSGFYPTRVGGLYYSILIPDGISPITRLPLLTSRTSIQIGLEVNRHDLELHKGFSATHLRCISGWILCLSTSLDTRLGYSLGNERRSWELAGHHNLSSLIPSCQNSDFSDGYAQNWPLRSPSSRGVRHGKLGW